MPKEVEVLLDIKHLRDKLEVRAGNVADDMKVIFDNPVPVYARSRGQDRSEPDESLQIGNANVSVSNGMLEGTITFEPTLEEFYTRYKQYKPRFVVISAVNQDGNQVNGLQILWIEAR
jgi:hypothetical protein